VSPIGRTRTLPAGELDSIDTFLIDHTAGIRVLLAPPTPETAEMITAGGVKTLPIWIFQSFRLANQVPLVNVAGLVAILLSVIPVYIATRISSEAVSGRT